MTRLRKINDYLFAKYEVMVSNHDEYEETLVHDEEYDDSLNIVNLLSSLMKNMRNDGMFDEMWNLKQEFSTPSSKFDMIDEDYYKERIKPLVANIYNRRFFNPVYSLFFKQIQKEIRRLREIE
jgi:hypothetical protein